MRLQSWPAQYKSLLKDNPIGLLAAPVVGMDGNNQQVPNYGPEA
jgi:hypothetical protein